MSLLSTQFSGLKSIKQIINEFRLQPNKDLGQNFLLDSSIPDRMVLNAGELAGKTVLEVGPGPGILTRSILASNVKKVIAVEMDPRCISALQSLQDAASDRLFILQKDALHANWQEITQGLKYTVIANLPYNIATQLVTTWLKNILQVEKVIVMLQKEVAQRFCATPNCHSYGRLAVLTQARWHAEILFDVAAEEFYPAPKVTSSVICFSPNNLTVNDELFKKVEIICATAFAHKRKMVKTGLGKLFHNAPQILEEIGARSDARAEQLDLKQYLALAEKLK